MENSHLRLIVFAGAVALGVAFAAPAFADVPFLMVFQERGWRQWTVIPFALFIEFLALRFFFEMPWKRAVVADLAMNAASALVAMIPTRGPLGVSWDIITLLRIYMFSGLIEVVGTVTVVALVDTVAEYAVLRLAFSQSWTWKRGLALLAANLATGGIILGSFSAPSSLAGIFGSIQDGYAIGGLAIDSSGAIYGGTMRGRSGHGLVYKLTPLETAPAQKWGEKVIHDFAGGADGSEPQGLILDRTGALYGVTKQDGEYGQGTVFKLTPPASKDTPWALATLHNFEGDRGAVPGLTLDSSGALYGVTQAGVVFRLSPPVDGDISWRFEVIFRFAEDVHEIVAPLLLDKSGALYGATTAGGAAGKGSIFRLVPPEGGEGMWTKSVLYSLPRLSDGRDGFPFPGSLIFDDSGSLYGVTQNGGAMSKGSVFRLSPPVAAGRPWRETTLYSFDGEENGHGPVRIFLDSSSAIYGATFRTPSIAEPAVLFKLTPAPGEAPWRFDTLYKFSQREDDQPPFDLVRDSNGIIYGVTIADNRMVMLARARGGGPSWTLTTVHRFLDR